MKDFFSYVKPDVAVEVSLCVGHFQFTWQPQPVYPYWKSTKKLRYCLEMKNDSTFKNAFVSKCSIDTSV